MEIINTVIGVPLGIVMRWCFELVGNYGVAIIIFTFLTKIILFPVSMWSQKNSIKMIEIKPALNMVEVQYAGNRDKIAEEQLALYKKQKYKPWLGFLPLLVQLIIVFGLISVVYHPLQHLLRIDGNVIAAFLEKTKEIMNVAELGSGAHLNIMELVKNPEYTQIFASLPVQGAADAVSKILTFDLNFLGLDLSATPSLSHITAAVIIPLLSGASAFFLSWVQNKVNVLQKEANWLGRWGMAIFLTAFSLYFAFVVPTGVGLYWILGNLFAVVVLFAANAIMPPKKYIDYDALEKSKTALAQTRKYQKKNKPSKEQKQRAKEDYKRFLDLSNKKQLVVYAEKNGYYKYFADIIGYVIDNSDIVVHYVTSDPSDSVFTRESDQLKPYYIDDNRLVVLFMEMDADVVLMTTPNLQQMYLKRSYVRKDIEYIYTQHALIVGLRTVRKGALDYFDTVFFPGKHDVAATQKQEELYGLKKKKLIECGYPLLDNMRQAFKDMPPKDPSAPRSILIAPSYQDNNILESCLIELLDCITAEGYDITVRPHPQYVKRFPYKYENLKSECARFSGQLFRFEDDFASSMTVINSDMVITDWSSIAYEFAFSTEKPVMFIDTPMKVINEDAVTEQNTAGNEDDSDEFKLRNIVGISLKMDEITDSSARTIKYLFDHQGEYTETISAVVADYISNLGRSAEIAGGYIINTILNK